MKTPYILAAGIVAYLRPARIFLPGLAVVLLGQSAARADFSGAFAVGNFTQQNSNSDGFVNPSGAPSSITITSGNNGSGAAGDVKYMLNAPANGRATFNWSFVSSDAFGATGESFGVVQNGVGSSRVDLQACKLEYSIVSPK